MNDNEKDVVTISEIDEPLNKNTHRATKEIDEPLRFTYEKLARKLIPELTDPKVAKDEKAYKLLRLCIFSILSIYFAEFLLGSSLDNDNNLFTSFIEVFKALIFTLSGYLFAKEK